MHRTPASAHTAAADSRRVTSPSRSTSTSSLPVCSPLPAVLLDIRLPARCAAVPISSRSDTRYPAPGTRARRGDPHVHSVPGPALRPSVYFLLSVFYAVSRQASKLEVWRYIPPYTYSYARVLCLLFIPSLFWCPAPLSVFLDSDLGFLPNRLVSCTFPG